MSFTLRSAVVYNEHGESRRVEFRRSGLNVLTGVAKKGKSAIIDIVDYCLGRNECYVAAGVIWEHASWFGVEVVQGNDVLFIGRRCPGDGKRTSPDIFVRRGNYESLPRFEDLRKNETEEGLTSLVTRLCGIAENEHRPASGSRRPLEATIRHALFVCLQKQDEIASRDRLFHRQGEPFIPQAIKDTMPYFLGAVEEDHFLLQAELDDARGQLARLEAQRDAGRSDEEATRGRIRRLVRDAQRVGLVRDEVVSDTLQEGLAVLRTVAQSDVRSPEIVARGSEVIGRLESEVRSLQGRLNDLIGEIGATRHFLREQSAYTREVGEQRARLEALDLYTGSSDDDHVCPVCESRLEVPTASQVDLAESLEELDKQLASVGAERPHLQERLDSLGKRRAEVEATIVSTQRDLERAYADDERARLQRDEAIERARVIGRIGALVDDAGLENDRTALDLQIEEARTRVAMLSDRVDMEDVEERVFTFLNLIADYMTEYAGRLELEHAEGRIRLDLKRLSVVAETVSGPIPLYRIGSGENWVGYHVVALLALHRWFRERHRPVPGFLVLDQPSQAHYPADSDADSVDDVDRVAVHSLFRFLHDEAERIGDGFQLIVLDHASFDDDWFERDVVENWRGDAGLIPAEWIEGDRG